MFLIAITINKNHSYFSDNIDSVLLDLSYYNDYIELVEHKESKDIKKHYHALLWSKNPLVWHRSPKNGKSTYHSEAVRNVKAYQKYMHNHDTGETRSIGELPYFEKTDDDMIDFCIKNGPVATVQTYGIKALSKYNQLKNFYEDYQDWFNSGGELK